MAKAAVAVAVAVGLCDALVRRAYRASFFAADDELLEPVSCSQARTTNNEQRTTANE